LIEIVNTLSTTCKIQSAFTSKCLNKLRNKVISNFMSKTDNNVELMFLNLAFNIRTATGERNK
jgi:hypothetical protein